MGRVEGVTCLLGLTGFCVWVCVQMQVTEGRTIPWESNSRVRRASGGEHEPVDPWIFNQAVCPPVLCGPTAGPVGGGDTDGRRAETKAFPFFEGDIVLDKAMSDRLARARGIKKRPTSRDARRYTSGRTSRDSTRGRMTYPARKRRSIVRPIKRLWQYGIIPYVIDQALDEATKRYIERAMLHVENATCITFRPRNETHDADYLFFIDQPGCWSYVGRRSGAQYVSLGHGCSYFGTALHEMTHAIGFWHEQSRLDRDDHVRLVTSNLAPSAIDQFGIRQQTESTSRGFAYDYGSIMHYGTHYFSSNGKATLRVSGVGQTLGLKIGQRRHLSDLDIAQLRDMYHCNDKDAEQRACKQGWKKKGDSCYLFVTSPRQQFSGAERACRGHGGHLVSIETQEEDKFIKDTLIQFYTNFREWRTGGRKRGSVWVWYVRGAPSQVPLNYTKWAPNHPGRYGSHILAKYDGKPPRFVWRGEPARSRSKPPKYTHSYICETAAKEECVVSKRHGRNYRGTLSYTRKGVWCQKWTAQYPHRHKYLKGSRKAEDETRFGLGDHNYCRNPDSVRKKRPWCFTNLSARRWQYCDVKVVTKMDNLKCS